MIPSPNNSEGLLLVDKPLGKTSFYLVHLLRKLTGLRKIGHAGTLDPFATGVMVMLIGKSATTRQDQFLKCDKEYRVRIKLGEATDSYDNTGAITDTSPYQPTHTEIETAIAAFQGTLLQEPPMFSAKKIKGKRLYEMARQGMTIERAPQKIEVTTTLIAYHYPYLELSIACSKGTYIRSIAHDIGLKLGTYGHADTLVRTKSGNFSLDQCLSVENLADPHFNYKEHLQPCSSPVL